MNLSRTFLWRKLRERKILKQHARVAAICEKLIADWRTSGVTFDLEPKHHFDYGQDNLAVLGSGI